VRSIVCRYATLTALREALRSSDHELPLPSGESIQDGEWLLAIVEVEGAGRATAAAARGVRHGDNLAIAFEPRDWAKLSLLVDASEASLARLAATATDDDEAPPTDASPDPGARTTMPSMDTSAQAAPGTARPSMPSSSFVRRFGAAEGARVLLVDDDAELCEVVAAMLEAVGFTVESVPSGERALGRLDGQVAETKVDLVVLDWTLPGMSGIDLCRAIRGRELLAGVPVLFLTANGSSRDIVDAFASGADDYVVKPFRAPELGARIFGLLRRSRPGTMPPPAQVMAGPGRERGPG
jgi:two-component system, OmpR family, phosphate regulon response regulator PhoB